MITIIIRGGIEKKEELKKRNSGSKKDHQKEKRREEDTKKKRRVKETKEIGRTIRCDKKEKLAIYTKSANCAVGESNEFQEKLQIMWSKIPSR